MQTLHLTVLPEIIWCKVTSCELIITVAGDQSMFSSFVEGSTKTSGELLGRLYKTLSSIPLQSLKRLVIGNQGKNL